MQINTGVFGIVLDIDEENGSGNVSSNLYDMLAPTNEDIEKMSDDFDPDTTDFCIYCQSAMPIGSCCPVCGKAHAIAEGICDGIEALILALHTEGYDVKDPKFLCAIEMAVEGAANNLK